MIVLLTDYGYQGPYVGQLKAKILEYSPLAKLIDLMHDLPAYNIHAAASLLPAITKNFPLNTIFICIVDPGVGSDRKPVLIKTDNYFYIGPDNGIFDKLITTTDNIKQWEIIWRPESMSNSFHGRDIFAPIACQLFNKTLNFETCLNEYPVESDSNLSNNENQLIYFDSFGNAITSINFDEISETAHLKILNNIISHGRIFSELPIGDCFWYENSMDLVEIACNQASVKAKLKLSIGQKIEILK